MGKSQNTDVRPGPHSEGLGLVFALFRRVASLGTSEPLRILTKC